MLTCIMLSWSRPLFQIKNCDIIKKGIIKIFKIIDPYLYQLLQTFYKS